MPTVFLLVRIEDGDSEYIYHSEQFLVSRKQLDQVRALEVTIPVREPLPAQYHVRVTSDSWVGCDYLLPVSFKNLILPTVSPPKKSINHIYNHANSSNY